MEYRDFMDYVGQMQEFYDKTLSDIELEVWYNNFKYMTLERFNDVICEAFKTSKYLPKLSELLQIQKTLPYTQPVKQTKDGKCQKCSNTGYVLYTRIVDNKPYTYSAVCDCGRANRYDGKEIVDPKNKSDYYIPTMTEIGLEIKSNMPSPEEVIKSMNKLKNNPIISENIRNVIRNRFRELYRK